MPSLVSALSALAVVSFALATPIWRANQTFTIYEDVPKPFVPGPVLLLETYQKFGVIPPPEVLAAAVGSRTVIAAAVESGSVIASPSQYDIDYLCPVTIGGQTLNLDFDTGSSDLWVFSSEMPPSQSAGHNIYDPSKSSTAEEMHYFTWDTSYTGGSSASGNVYLDTVTVGEIIITGQAVELAEQVSAQFVTGPSDGVLGLSLYPNTIDPYHQNTFFENAVNGGVAAVFTVDLKKGAPGSYDFGFIDPTKYIAPITYVPVTEQDGTWEFIYSGYAVGGGSFQGLSSDALMDTGTSLLYLDELIVNAYYAEVPGAILDPTLYAWTFPCSASLPSLTLTIGTHNAVIPGTYMNAYPTSTGACYGGLQNDTNFPSSIVGAVFIKSQFVVFDFRDFNNKVIGVAAKNFS